MFKALKTKLKPVLALLAGLLSITGSSFADTNTDKSTHYHFQATLSEGSASLRSVALPWSVVSNLLQENQQDLQVYNADAQAVPFTIRSVAASAQTQQQTRTLNFFPMGDIEKLGTILKHEADEQRYNAIKLIQTGQRYLIIDNPDLDVEKNPLPLQKLTLDWEGLTHWLPKSLQIEISDDLTRWQSVSIEKLPYRMAESGVVLENHELVFKQPILKRFIRLSGGEDFAPLLKALTKASGLYQRTRVSRPINWNNVELQATPTARQYRYDLPPSLPVKRWRLEGLSPDSLYKGSLYARSTQRLGKKVPDWRMRQSFLQYSIKMDGGVITSDASQATNSGWSREWRIDLEQDFTADTVPKLALAWEPLELVFVAQGQGPFQIRYASRTTRASARMDLNQLLKEATPEAVNIVTTEQLSVVAEKDDGTPYQYLLWGFLAAAVLMLLYMAKGLLKEMGS